MSWIPRAVAVAAGTAVLTIAVAAPAQAAPPALPSGDALYAIACPYYTDATVPTTNNQLLIVDTTDASAVNRGSGAGGGNATSDSNCAAGAAWNPVTETAYFVYWSEDDEYPMLATIDRASGVATVIGEFTDAGVVNDYIAAIAIGADGSAYAVDYDGYALFSLDLATAELTLINADVGFGSDPYGFAYNPADSKFYAADEDGYFYEIDVSDGAVSPLGQPSGISIDGVYGFTIDSNGVAWFNNDEDYLDEYAAQLWSVDLGDFATAAEFSGNVRTGASDFVYTESFFVASFVDAPAAIEPAAPELAETGLDGSAAALAAFAVASVLLGATFLASRRRASLR
ncbi:MAG: hypothetical protein CMF56_07145 [Leifsonia sp.]|nr:hypothetical protein [Leifsonia sp.]|tara:strand:- start:106327 stop:107352 length:1026 start_codon:yes stop_codon:yes gene_type:complete